MIYFDLHQTIIDQQENSTKKFSNPEIYSLHGTNWGLQI